MVPRACRLQILLPFFSATCYCKAHLTGIYNPFLFLPSQPILLLLPYARTATKRLLNAITTTLLRNREVSIYCPASLLVWCYSLTTSITPTVLCHGHKSCERPRPRTASPSSPMSPRALPLPLSPTPARPMSQRSLPVPVPDGHRRG